MTVSQQVLRRVLTGISNPFNPCLRMRPRSHTRYKRQLNAAAHTPSSNSSVCPTRSRHQWLKSKWFSSHQLFLIVRLGKASISFNYKIFPLMWQTILSLQTLFWAERCAYQLQGGFWVLFYILNRYNKTCTKISMSQCPEFCWNMVEQNPGHRWYATHYQRGSQLKM